MPNDSGRCPDCVEGHTHDVCDGEPVVEVCGSCHGTGKLGEGDTEPGEPEGDLNDPRDLLRRVLAYAPSPPSRGLLADIEAYFGFAQSGDSNG